MFKNESWYYQEMPVPILNLPGEIWEKIIRENGPETFVTGFNICHTIRAEYTPTEKDFFSIKRDCLHVLEQLRWLSLIGPFAWIYSGNIHHAAQKAVCSILEFLLNKTQDDLLLRQSATLLLQTMFTFNRPYPSLKPTHKEFIVQLATFDKTQLEGLLATMRQ